MTSARIVITNNAYLKTYNRVRTQPNHNVICTFKGNSGADAVIQWFSFPPKYLVIIL